MRQHLRSFLENLSECGLGRDLERLVLGQVTCTSRVTGLLAVGELSGPACRIEKSQHLWWKGSLFQMRSRDMNECAHYSKLFKKGGRLDSGLSEFYGIGRIACFLQRSRYSDAARAEISISTPAAGNSGIGTPPSSM